jgi:ADP-ribose pyrophosphatase
MSAIPTPIGDEKIEYQGRVIEVVEQPMQVGEKIKTFEFARRSPGTRMVVVSPEGKILLSKEYRTETQNVDYRLPGGKVFDTLEEYNQFLKSGQNILEAAERGVKKEAEQEAGIKISTAKHVYTSKCGATVVWDLYYFIVTDYEELSGQNLEEGESIEKVWVAQEEAEEICLSGQMQEDRSVAVLLRHLRGRFSV